MNQVPLVSIVGKKKSGKTTTLVGLAAELTARGWRVATIKHSHGFTMDHAGRDSWRHREEGHAIRTVVASEDEVAVVGGWPDAQPLTARELTERYLADADMVLVEGYKDEQLPTIEVFQQARHERPWYDAEHAAHYIAIATDDGSLQADLPVLDINVPDLASRLANLVEQAVLFPAYGSRRILR